MNTEGNSKEEKELTLMFDISQNFRSAKRRRLKRRRKAKILVSLSCASVLLIVMIAMLSSESVETDSAETRKDSYTDAVGVEALEKKLVKMPAEEAEEATTEETTTEEATTEETTTEEATTEETTTEEATTEEATTEEATTEEATTEAIAEVSPSAYGPGEYYYYNLSEEDKITIAKVVYREARGEPFEGQVAVAATVLNRMKRYSTDVNSVLGAYAPIGNVGDEQALYCMEAVEQATRGYDPTREMFEQGARYFYNPDGDISENELAKRRGVRSLTIGNHVFHDEFADE